MAGTSSLTNSTKTSLKPFSTQYYAVKSGSDLLNINRCQSITQEQEPHEKAFTKYKEGWILHCTQSDFQSLQKFAMSCFTNLCEHVWAPLLQNKQDTLLPHAKNSSTGGISALKASVISQNYHRGGFGATSGFWMTEARKALYYKKSVQK